MNVCLEFKYYENHTLEATAAGTSTSTGEWRIHFIGIHTAKVRTQMGAKLNIQNLICCSRYMGAGQAKGELLGVANNISEPDKFSFRANFCSVFI